MLLNYCNLQQINHCTSCFYFHSETDLLRWLVSVVANLDWAACSLPSTTDNYTGTHKFIFKYVKVQTRPEEYYSRIRYLMTTDFSRQRQHNAQTSIPINLILLLSHRTKATPIIDAVCFSDRLFN